MYAYLTFSGILSHFQIILDLNLNHNKLHIISKDTFGHLMS